jgi:hypothetical protein
MSISEQTVAIQRASREQMSTTRKTGAHEHSAENPCKTSFLSMQTGLSAHVCGGRGESCNEKIRLTPFTYPQVVDKIVDNNVNALQKAGF